MDKVRLELHTHTRYSKDSMLGKIMYLIMLKLRKIDVIGITDHNTIKGGVEYKQFLEKYGIKVIVGEEIFTSKGEIIGLFLSKQIESGLSPKETIQKIKEQNGVVYIPHPYDEKRYKTVLNEKYIEENIKDIDIIECHNGRNISLQYSKKQNEIAEKFKKLKMVGSDAHIFFELGRNFNLIKNFSDKDEFLKNLNSIEFVKKDCIKISHQITKVVKLIKLLIEGELCELYRIIRRKYKNRK
ncbi:PHP domain-containing protein [Fusobacterium sp.]|uniref:PHP domain-containing protein n=1 Tax=Fusobacterium sp. TaxID=68766 RepID=UPI00260544EF|nr:PHP domain-containing protein [Fusobacterium sp.]